MPTRRIGLHVMEEALRLRHECGRSQRRSQVLAGCRRGGEPSAAASGAGGGLVVADGLGKGEVAGAAVRAPGRRDARLGALHFAVME